MPSRFMPAVLPAKKDTNLSGLIVGVVVDVVVFKNR